MEQGSQQATLTGRCTSSGYLLGAEGSDLPALAGEIVELASHLAWLLGVGPRGREGEGIAVRVGRDELEALVNGESEPGPGIARLIEDARAADDDAAVELAERLLNAPSRWLVRATWDGELGPTGRAYEVLDTGVEYLSVHPLAGDQLVLFSVTPSVVWRMLTTLLPFDDELPAA